MSNINTPQKTPGQLHLADEMNVQTNWTNSPGLQLGTFSPSMVFNSQGNHLDYVATSDIVFTASAIVAFNVRKVKITTDGTHTFSVGGGVRLISGSLGLIAAGTYDFIFGSFDANEVLLSVPGIAQQPTPTLTTPTLTATPQSQAITIVWTNEDAAQTGRELLRSTTDNISTAVPVVGYDGTASYLDDNDGAGLVNGTTYYYWGRNTASGYNPSGYGTTNSTPGTVQLTQPTGLSATGGQDSNVPLSWNAIDSNADNVSVERSLSSGSGFAQLILLAQSATSHDDTTAVNDTTYYYRVIAKGSGNYSDSDPSAESSATPSLAPSFLIAEYLANNNFLDTSGNALNGAGTDVTFVNDRDANPNSAFSFNGSSFFIDVADDPLLDMFTGAYSVSFWINVADANWQVISKGTLGNTNEEMRIQIFQDEVIFRVYDAAAGGDFIGAGVESFASYNTWVHIVCTWDGTTSQASPQIFVDAVNSTTRNQASGTFTGVQSAATPLQFGRYDTSYMAGSLDDLRFYNKVLSQQEITDLYNE